MTAPMSVKQLRRLMKAPCAPAAPHLTAPELALWQDAADSAAYVPMTSDAGTRFRYVYWTAREAARDARRNVRGR